MFRIPWRLQWIGLKHDGLCCHILLRTSKTSHSACSASMMHPTRCRLMKFAGALDQCICYDSPNYQSSAWSNNLGPFAAREVQLPTTKWIFSSICWLIHQLHSTNPLEQPTGTRRSIYTHIQYQLAPSPAKILICDHYLWVQKKKKKRTSHKKSK